MNSVIWPELDRLGDPGLLPDELQQPVYLGLGPLLALLRPHPVQGVLVDLVVGVHVKCGVSVKICRSRPGMLAMLY